MSLNFDEGPFPSVDQVHYNERIIPSPLTITDKTCEYILSDVVRQNKKLLFLGIAIITTLLYLMLIIRCICSKYYWKKDEQQTENLQQDSKDLKQVIVHQDEPEDLSVVINPKMKLLATI
jgi:DNA-binding helix-hairpin-helix protein with protein kinase domain